MADRDVWTAKAELEPAQARRGVADRVAEIERRRADRTECVQPIEIVDQAVQARCVRSECHADLVGSDVVSRQQIRVRERQAAGHDGELADSIDAAQPRGRDESRRIELEDVTGDM